MLCERDRHHSGMIVRLKRASNRVGEAQWWPDEIDAVGETNLGQHLRVRLRSEVLEKSLYARRRGDDQQSSSLVADVLEAVRDASWPEGHTAGRRREQLAAGLNRNSPSSTNHSSSSRLCW